MTAAMRVVLKRSLRRGEWVTRLENMQTGGEFWGHYFEDYEIALRDFESRCLKLGVSPIPAERYIEEAAQLVAALLETSPDEVDPVRYLKDLAGPDKRIRITYSRTTPESAEQGDFSETGWINQEGEDMTPDLYDIEEGKTAVDKAVEFLKNEGVIEPSSSDFHPGNWYSTEWQNVDMRTGEDEERSYHLVGFTPEEEKEIYDRVIRKRQ